jgi:DNA-binding beta-propeller fold protein YncE
MLQIRRNTRAAHLAVASLATMFVAACGGIDGESVCGEGTFFYEGSCVAFDPTDDVPPSTEVSPGGGPFYREPDFVLLTPSEPATVYYTIDGTDPTEASASGLGTTKVAGVVDGTELRFFAVDLAGNAEPIRSEIYSRDVDAPGPVTAMEADEDAENDITVTWGSPDDEDYAGVLIIRVIGRPELFEPRSGDTYEIGEEVAPGQTVVFIGDAEEFVDEDPAPGFDLYVAYSFDSVFNYGERAQVLGQNSTSPVLTATIRVHLSPLPSVDIVTAPDLLPLTGTATYDFDTDTMRVQITAENRFAKLLYNPKLVVNSIEQGTLANPSSPVAIDGRPWIYYGPESIGILDQSTRELVFTGVDGTIDPVEMNVTFVSHPLLITGEGSGLRVGDSFPTGLRAQIPCSLGNSGSCNFTEAIYTKDGAKVFLADGRRPAVVVLDLATLSTSAGPDLSGRGFIDSINLSPDGETIYAVLNTNAHRQLNSSSGTQLVAVGQTYLVKIDARTLEERSRVLLVSATQGDKQSRARGHRLSITADGREGAMAVKNIEKVFHLDLETMEVLREIQMSPGIAGAKVRYAAIRPDGAEIYVCYRNAMNRLEVINTANYAISPLLIEGATISGRPGDMLFGPDGRLYFSRKNIPAGNPGLVIITPGAAGFIPMLTGSSVYGVDFSPDGSKMYVADQVGSVVRVYAIPGEVQLDTDGNAGNGLQPIVSGTHRAHAMIISPL